MADEREQTDGNPAGEQHTPATGGEQDNIDKYIDIGFAKGAKKVTNDFLSTLGVESIDDLKSIITKNKENEDKNKTELDKALEVQNNQQKQNDKLIKTIEGLTTQNKVGELALAIGAKDKSYLEYMYAKEIVKDDFNEDTFIKNMKDNHFGALGIEGNRELPNPQGGGNNVKTLERNTFLKMQPLEQKEALKKGIKIID